MTKEHGCCIGIAYYTKKMKENMRDPICLGLRTSPNSIQLPGSSPQPQPIPEAAWDKHICLGCSMWERFASQRAQGSSQDSAQLPHCEGVEVLLVNEAEIADGAQDAQPGSSDQDGSNLRAQQQSQRVAQGQPGEKPSVEQQPPVWERLLARAEKNIQAMQAQLNNEGFIKFKESPENLAQLQERLWATAAQNKDRLLTVVKPWMDRWSERWSGNGSGSEGGGRSSNNSSDSQK